MRITIFIKSKQRNLKTLYRDVKAGQACQSAKRRVGRIEIGIELAFIILSRLRGEVGVFKAPT